MWEILCCDYSVVLAENLEDLDDIRKSCGILEIRWRPELAKRTK